MNYRGAAAALSKFDYGATLVVVAGDAPGPPARPGRPRPVRRGGEHGPAAQRHPVAGHRDVGPARDLRPARKTELGGLLRSLTDRIRRRGLLVIVSDLFTDLDAVYDGLNRLRFLGHEVLVLQVLDRDELELPFDGPTVFHDIEGDEELFAEPGAFRQAYRRR